MKVILVGMYNKPDTKPLCVTTKTGKLLQRIIKELPHVEFVKTNLYDIEYYPHDLDKKVQLANDWHWRIKPDIDDVIVLLGAEVHQHFIRNGFKVIKLAHPASKRSHVEMDEFVSRGVNQIKSMIK